MNGKLLALLFAVALTAATEAAQACGVNKFNVPAEAVSAAAYAPLPPPVAGHPDHRHRGAVASATATLDSRAEVRGAAVKLAASSILSWTHKIAAFLDPRIVEESCLATAVYFEARSESRLGQLAVATVILNRAKTSNYPSSICGVVYQGASRMNACQFSFACDGKPDLPNDSRAWETARAVTALALADHVRMKNAQRQIVSTATHYHADYVEPRWSKSLHRLTKIGRHIFYSQG